MHWNTRAFNNLKGMQQSVIQRRANCGSWKEQSIVWTFHVNYLLTEPWILLNNTVGISVRTTFLIRMSERSLHPTAGTTVVSRALPWATGQSPAEAEREKFHMAFLVKHRFLLSRCKINCQLGKIREACEISVSFKYNKTSFVIKSFCYMLGQFSSLCFPCPKWVP